MASTTSSNLTIRPKYESMDFSGSVYLVSGDGKIISLPMPSQSARDPLNWSLKRRALAFLSITCFSIISMVLLQGQSSFFLEIHVAFSPQDMSPFGPGILLSAPQLFLGGGALFWIPLSLAVGRRPTFVLASLILTMATLWAGLTDNFSQYLCSLCLGAIAQSFSLSASLLQIIDMTFIHERPQAIALCWSANVAIAFTIFSLTPEMSSDGTNRKLFYQVWVLPCVAVLILVYCFYPETYFIRPAQCYDGRILAQSATEKTEFYKSWEECPGGEVIPDQPDIHRWWFMRSEYRLFVTTRSGWRGMQACYSQVALCAINPLIFWVALLEAVSLCSLLSIGQTFVMTLTLEPYDLSPTNIARASFGMATGALLSWPVSSYILSFATKKLAMKNNGIREAEYYLPAFIIPVLSAALSNILYGLAIQRTWHPGYIVFAFSLNIFAFCALGIVGTLWVTEAFPRWAAAAIAVVYGLAYFASSCLSYSIIPWIRSQGIQGMQFELALAMIIVGCFGVPSAFFGKRVRQRINGRWADNEAGALRPQASEVEGLRGEAKEERRRRRNEDVELNTFG